MKRISPEAGRRKWQAATGRIYEIWAPYLSGKEWIDEPSGCEARELQNEWIVSDPDDGFFLATPQEREIWTLVPKN